MTKLRLCALRKNVPVRTIERFEQGVKKDDRLTKERPDPISEPAPEHGISILTSGDEKVSTVVEATVSCQLLR